MNKKLFDLLLEGGYVEMKTDTLPREHTFTKIDIIIKNKLKDDVLEYIKYVYGKN